MAQSPPNPDGHRRGVGGLIVSPLSCNCHRRGAGGQIDVFMPCARISLLTHYITSRRASDAPALDVPAALLMEEQLTLMDAVEHLAYDSLVVELSIRTCAHE